MSERSKQIKAEIAAKEAEKIARMTPEQKKAHDRRMGIVGAVALAAIVALVTWLLVRDNKPSDCSSTATEVRIIGQQVTDKSVTLLKSASLKRDGGEYISGSFRMLDGGNLTAVWYITGNGNGIITRVGAVTALISGGAESEKVGITTASKGFDEVKKCVE